MGTGHEDHDHAHDHAHDHGHDHAHGHGHDHDHGPPPKSRACLIIAIVAGVLVLAVCGIGILATLLLPALLRAKEKANRTRCANNMRQLSLSALTYAVDQRAFPYVANDAGGGGALRLLLDEGYLDSPEACVCPCVNGGGAYVFFPVPLPTNAPSTQPIGWEAAPHPLGEGGRNVAFADGSTRWVTEGEFGDLEALGRRLR